MNSIIQATTTILVGLIAYLLATSASAPFSLGRHSDRGPRAVCNIRNPDGICVFWTYYGAAQANPGETIDSITEGYAAKCYQAGDRYLKFQQALNDGGLLYSCFKK